MKPGHAHSILLLPAHLCYVSVQAPSNFTRFRSSADRSSVLVQPEMERSSVSTSGSAVIPEECERCSGPSMQLASVGGCRFLASAHTRLRPLTPFHSPPTPPPPPTPLHTHRSH